MVKSSLMSTEIEAPPREYTIDQLALMAGMTVRNIRAHQANGLLPPPQLRGRTGYYGDEHLDRLRLIRDMQSAGFNLRAIGRILAALPAGVAADVHGLERTLRAAWTEEPHEVMTLGELAGHFPGLDDSTVLGRIAELGLVTDLGDGRVEINSPTMLRVGETLWRLGVPLRAAVQAQAELTAHAERIAATYVELFLDEVWRPFADAGQPDADWPRIRRVLDELRPLALESLVTTFRSAMSRAVDDAIADVIENQTGVPARAAGA